MLSVHIPEARNNFPGVESQLAVRLRLMRLQFVVCVCSDFFNSVLNLRVKVQPSSKEALQQ
jgi:hypothetical protein